MEINTKTASDEQKRGPDVQSIISLMSSLRGHLVKCFRTETLTNDVVSFEQLGPD